MHIGYEDFCRLTPGEYAAACEAFARHADELRRDEWERTRTAAWLLLQPYMKQRHRPESVLPLPWDKTKPAAAAGPRKTETREERRKRFEALVERSKRTAVMGSAGHRGEADGGDGAGASLSLSKPL